MKLEVSLRLHQTHTHSEGAALADVDTFYWPAQINKVTEPVYLLLMYFV